MLQKVYNWLQKEIDSRSARTFFFICAAVMFFASHTYGLVNPILAHDSLSEINLFGNVDFAGMDDYILKIRAGRFTEVLYQCLIRGKLALPWLTGMLSFCWLTATCYLVIGIFHLQRRIQIILLCGLFMTNITVTSTIATYIHDADTNFLGLMLATLSINYWRRGGRYYLYGVICIIFSLGCYQSYLSVTIVLAMILSIVDLMNGQPVNSVFRRGMKAVLMLVISGVIYLLLVFITTRLCHTEIGGNLGTFGESQMPLLNRLYMTYYRCLTTAIGPVSLMNHSVLKIISITVILFGCFPVYSFLLNRNSSIGSRFLVIILLVLLPLGMNITYMLCPGGVTELSSFAYWFFYLLVIVLLPWYKTEVRKQKKKALGRTTLASILLLTLILGNIQTANAAYLLREFWYSATLSAMTRITGRMETTDGYEAGITPVCVIGIPIIEIPAGYERIADMTGLNMGGPVSFASRAENYYEYYLAQHVKMVDGETRNKLESDPMVMALHEYPAADSIQIQNGVLVVKLHEQRKPEK